MSKKPRLSVPGIDSEFIDNWHIHSAFDIYCVNDPIDMALEITQRDTDTCGDDPHFMTLYDDDTKILELVPSGYIAGTQFEAIERTSKRYRLVLGDLSVATALIRTTMNTAAVVDAFEQPHIDVLMDTYENSLSQPELDIMMARHSPDGLDVTDYVRQILKTL